MRFPILLGPFPPPAGGVATFFTRLCDLLTEHNYSFRLKRIGGAEDPIRMSWASWQKHLSDVQAGDIVLDNGTSFIENPSRRPMIMWMLWRLIKRFRWIKVFHSGTLPARYEKFTWQQKLLFRLNIQLVDEIICVNDEIADWLRDVIKVSQRINRISSLLPFPLNQADDTELCSLPEADYLILTIGVFTENYGFDDILQAIRLVREKTNVNIKLTILDAAFDVDLQYQDHILQGISWIHTFTALKPSQVQSIMKQSDLFVRATRQESYGLSKVEALLTGLPVICTETGETRGMTTYLAGDINDLADKILQQMQKDRDSKLNEWQAFYQTKAENNLKHLTSILYGELCL